MMTHVKHTTSIVKLKLSSMLKSSLCDCCDEYKPVKGNITIVRRAANAVAREGDKKD